MATIQESITKMIELRGLDIFRNPKQFFAFLDDLSPEYPRERRIIKNNFDDKLLGLFVDDTKKVGHRLRRIREELEDFGFTDDKIYFILESFGIPLGWEQEILDLKADFPAQGSNFNKQAQKQNEVSEDVQDVTLNDDFLKLLGFMDKSLISSVLNIPPTYRPPLSGITYRIVKIGDEVFKGCEKLQFVTIPDTVTEIGNSAFENCKSLEKINIPDSVIKIGDRAFANCKLLSDIVLPNSIIEIGKSTFGGCSSLISVHLPNNITKISEGLFGECKSLLNINIPNGVTEIEDFAFAGCESLNSVLIPKTVTKIGAFSFANCKSLDSIILPNNVTNIDKETFCGCLQLHQFTLPTRFTIFKDYVNKQIDLKNRLKSQSNPIISSSTSLNPFTNAKVGEYIKFGSYPQTSNGDIKPIEWLVLSIENNKMLVISRYGLDAKRFDDDSNVWANSKIRKWLNGEFYNKAFTDQEKKYINLSNLSDVGTSDNVFLLSEGEAEKYFANKDETKCKATEYAVKNGAYVDISNGYSIWWLRSPDPLSDYVFSVNSDGGIDCYCIVDGDNPLARPALSINL